MYPCDEVRQPKQQSSTFWTVLITITLQTEMERLDIYNHIIYTVARKGELHKVPLIPTGETLPRLRILDVGCGTGIWAIEMAEYVWFSAGFMARLTSRTQQQIQRGRSTHPCTRMIIGQTC